MTTTFRSTSHSSVVASQSSVIKRRKNQHQHSFNFPKSPVDSVPLLAKAFSPININPLTINEDLPDKICKKCINIIEQIYKFCITVEENQHILQHHSQNGTLANYYLHLNNGNPLKKENNDFDVNTNIIYKHEIIENEKDEIANMVNSKDNNINNNVKIEDTDNEFYETINNSTDEEGDGTTEDSMKVPNNLSNEVLENTAILINDPKKTILDKHSCLSCNKICETHEQLKQHYNDEHTNKNNKTIEATYTETVFNGKVMYKCDVCSKIYAQKYLKRHLLKHTNERPYVCKLCSRTYMTVSDIMRHGFRVHSGIKLLCAYKCGFSSAYTGALKEHEDRAHKNFYKYTCGKCGKGFQVKTWYDQHQNIHIGVKPFVCDICGNAFHMEKYLTQHRGKMHPQCLDAKRLICVHCDLKCETENTLHLHLESEHGVIRKKVENRRKALCDLCGKILNGPEKMARHRRMHLGHKPYKCSICNKQFPRKFSMQVHERSHSGTNSHECSHCGKRYSQQSALYRHQRQQHALPLKRSKPTDSN